MDDHKDHLTPFEVLKYGIDRKLYYHDYPYGINNKELHKRLTMFATEFTSTGCSRNIAFTGIVFVVIGIIFGNMGGSSVILIGWLMTIIALALVVYGCYSVSKL